MDFVRNQEDEISSKFLFRRDKRRFVRELDFLKTGLKAQILLAIHSAVFDRGKDL